MSSRVANLIRSCALLAFGLATAACGTTRPPAGRNLGDQARSHYVAGMDELLGGNYTEAITELQQVAKNPGYISYAALARLRIGDALFLQEKYDAAIETYRSFLKQYEGNPNAGYARFRIGHAFFRQIPSGWFLAPPVYERQQDFVNHAAAELRRFVELHPTNAMVADARRMLDECERLLYEHEVYVAEFYQRRGKPAGVALRLESAFRRFPALASTEDNYLMLAKAYVRTQRPRKARATYQAYLERYPSGRYRVEASESLRTLESLENKGG